MNVYLDKLKDEKILEDDDITVFNNISSEILEKCYCEANEDNSIHKFLKESNLFITK